MNLVEAYRAYCENRAENIARMREKLDDFPHKNQFLEHVFWNNVVLDTQNNLQFFSAESSEIDQFNAVSFNPAEASPAVEHQEGFLRLQVSVHRVLDLTPFHEKEGYFRQLSSKNRKKLRWLSNAVPALGCRIVPLQTEEDFLLFEQLYSVQFPKYHAGCEANRVLWSIYRKFIEQGKSFSFILLSPDNKPLAAALGYLDGNSYNYTHLTRSSGEYDKYSPGYYLTYNIIVKLILEHPETDFFFMGPGDYDYKRALGGEAMAIYRYVRCSCRSLFRLMRLYFRAWKRRNHFKYLKR